ncbi:MAG: hypothetical protein IKE06_07570 [Solobacterium sp.]|nr:hypothetical protein [Solobacterium sp.]MBR3128836.1 hypothetical protein [Solobacterium sp.]
MGRKSREKKLKEKEPEKKVTVTPEEDDDEMETVFFGLYKRKRLGYAWDVSTDLVTIIVCLAFSATMLMIVTERLSDLRFDVVGIGMIIFGLIGAALGLRAVWQAAKHIVRMTKKRREKKAHE